MCEEIGEFKKIGEAEAKKLLSRMARFVGLELVEMPEDAWYKKHWCFSNEESRFTCNHFSLEGMLLAMLGVGEFSRCPGTWDAKVGEKTRYENPFYGMSLEELKIKLDLEEEAAKKKGRADGQQK